MINKKVGFVGIGKLGLACAQVMAKAGHDVTGYDIYPRSSDCVKIAATLQEAIEGKEVIFVAVQTPHDPIYDGSQPITHLDNKDFDYTIAKDVLRGVNQFVKPDQMVVLISTVLPGTTRRQLRDNITNARFVYNPYLIAMGSVEWDMVNPEMVIIGTEDGSTTGDAAELIEFYKTFMENDPRYVIGTWDEAECIKIFYNTFISAKVGLVNMIQDVAIKNGNIDVDVVTSALAASNMRIMGPKYMVAGMGDAGPCHPRDNIALRWLAENLDLGYDMFDAIMHAREKQAKLMAEVLVAEAENGNLPIYIHGKAYKPNVNYCDGSYSLLVGWYCKAAGIEPIYIDPLTEFNKPASVKGVVLLAHNQKITYGYSGVTDEQPLYCVIESGSVVVDPWRKYTTDDLSIKVIHYGNTRGQPGQKLS
jgi:UDPglucose 6-dehydrogenase